MAVVPYPKQYSTQLDSVAQVLLGLNNKSPGPYIGENARSSERERSKSQPTLNLRISQPKRSHLRSHPTLYSSLLPAMSLPVCLYRPPDLYG